VRPELRARILAAIERGSVLVVADGGFGKTTALEDALGASEMDAAWVPCRDAGGDPGRLLGLVVEAVRAAVPGAADVLAERLATAREPVDPERAAAALTRELERLLVDPLVLVLDDGEALDESPGALAVVSRLLAAQTASMRVALAARHRPGLRLARNRAAGRVLELGSGDLAFSAAECAAYLRLVAGREPDPEEVETLVEATDGWPLGIALAAGAAEPGGRGPTRGVADEYFAEEILGPLDPELRGAVLAASTAPDLDVAEAAGIGPEGGLADTLEGRGLFVRSGLDG
jgi:LuxR family transcriptional regulator, maltose regulon positive regulatory protein